MAVPVFDIPFFGQEPLFAPVKVFVIVTLPSDTDILCVQKPFIDLFRLSSCFFQSLIRLSTWTQAYSPFAGVFLNGFVTGVFGVAGVGVPAFTTGVFTVTSQEADAFWFRLSWTVTVIVSSTVALRVRVAPFSARTFDPDFQVYEGRFQLFFAWAVSENSCPGSSV
ncbi:MAG: hypothetical protein IPH43_14940 [Xanthomonadales bacterium]|nr:hypothetical protein [Xanthomonadales bacterium]